MSEFGKRLRYTRKQKGLSQKELAEQMDMTQAAISQFENGRRLPTPANIKRLAEILGVGHTDLAGTSEGEFEKEMLMRNAEGLSPESLAKINEYAEMLKEREKRKKSENDESQNL